MTIARWLYCDYSHSELIVFQTPPQPVQHLAKDMGIFVILLLNLVMISLRII